MIQDILVRFSLSMLQRVVVCGVRRIIVARFYVGEVALDVA